MKTFRMIGIALIAVLISVNFTSCSGNDDDPSNDEGGNIAVSKKLVEIKAVEESGEEKGFDFTYNHDGNVLTANYFRNDGISNYFDNSTFTWGDNTVIESVKNSSHIADTYTYKFTNGLISSNNDYSYAYDSSNRLTSCTSILSTNRYSEVFYTWSNDKLTKISISDNYIGEKTIEITYSGKKCKGYFTFIEEDFIVGNGNLVHAHPELYGLKITELPSKITIKDYYDTKIIELSYTLDKEGYITSYTTKNNKKSGNDEVGYKEYEYTTIYSFKWQ